MYNTTSKKFKIEGKRQVNDGLDEELSRRLKGNLDITEFTKMLENAIQIPCREMYGFKEKSKTKAKGRTVPWWTDGITTKKGRTNAL